MKKTILTFGTMAGVVIFAYTMIVFAILGDFGDFTPKELQLAEVLGYIRYVILLLGVIMAMVTFRRSTTGPLNYGQALKLGFLVAVVTAVFVGLMEYTYIAFINPNFIEEWAKVTIEAAKLKGATAAELAEIQAEVEMFAWARNPYLVGGFYFLETTVVGTIMAAIAAIFARRDEKGRSDAMIQQPA